MWIDEWKEKLKSLLDEGEDFGHNCWCDTEDTIRQFSKIEKFGGKVQIPDDEYPCDARIWLNSTKIGLENDLRILKHILMKMPAASSCIEKNKDSKSFLELSWHW